MIKRKLEVAALALATVAMASCNKEESVTPGNPNFSTATLKMVEAGGEGSGSGCTILWASQNINAGSVCYSDADTDGDGMPDMLLVTYQTTGGWMLGDVKFWIGTSLADMPQNPNGAPKIGQFPYKIDDVNSDAYTIEIPFSTLGYTCPDPMEFHVVANASVSNGGSSEGAWADGESFNTNGGWAMHNTIWISCPTEVETSTETAWAMLEDNSTCFSTIAGLNANNWGWSNGPLTDGSYSMALIAGAGQCTGGTVVGTVTLELIAGTATVTVNTSGSDASTGQPYTLEEVHVHIGNDILPLGNNGSYTNAPGQLGHNSGPLSGATVHGHTVSGLEGPIHVAVHAVVDGFPL